MHVQFAVGKDLCFLSTNSSVKLSKIKYQLQILWEKNDLKWNKILFWSKLLFEKFTTNQQVIAGKHYFWWKLETVFKIYLKWDLNAASVTKCMHLGVN